MALNNETQKNFKDFLEKEFLNYFGWMPFHIQKMHPRF
jgi:hypothetical protein